MSMVRQERTLSSSPFKCAPFPFSVDWRLRAADDKRAEEPSFVPPGAAEGSKIDDAFFIRNSGAADAAQRVHQGVDYTIPCAPDTLTCKYCKGSLVELNPRYMGCSPH